MHLDVWFTIPDMKDGKREILQIFIIQKDSTLKLFTKIIRNRLYSNILYQRAVTEMFKFNGNSEVAYEHWC